MIYTVAIPSEIFPGFYNTDYDPENFLEEDIELDYDIFYNYKQRICNRIVKIFKEYFPLTIISGEINSPKSYNYRNDNIELLIDTSPSEILKYVLLNSNIYDYLDNPILYDIEESAIKALMFVFIGEQIELLDVLMDELYI